MSIHVILGKPGGGKSLYATRRVLEELAEGQRNIVTNLPIRLDALNEYVQKRWPGRDLQPVQRIRLLSDAEVRYFWKFRSAADEAPPELQQLDAVTDDDARKPLLKVLDAWAKTPSTGDFGKGVAYFLDEAHIPFNARAWATVATAALFYLSQHRKLGDVVWPITQSPGNLDKQFRSVAEDFTLLRNEYTAKFGPFRGRGRFVRRTYLAEPTANAEPFESGSFSLDGVKDCYDTAKGIGVHGNKADIGRRAKGIPIWTVVPAAMAVGLLCVGIPWVMGKGAQKFLTGGAQEKIAAAAVGPLAAGPAAKPAAAIKGDASPADLVTRVAPQMPANGTAGLFVKGWITRGGRVNVVLSDGRTLTEGDGMLVRVERNSVTLADGSKLWMHAPVWSATAPACTPPVRART